MDIVAILQGLKGKVLDLKDIELLKHTYDLQDQNQKQLKTNNDALRENAELVREKITRLQTEIDRLSAENQQLRAEADRLRAASTPSAPTTMDPNDCITRIQSWMGHRDTMLNRAAITYSEVDRELNLPPGSAKKYIEEAAKHYSYVPLRKGEETILFQEVYNTPPVAAYDPRPKGPWRVF